MAQGDAYIYHWTSYNNNNLSLQPSSGTEWMFTSSACTYASSDNGVRLNTTSSGNTYNASAYTHGGSTSNRHYSNTASGGDGLSTFNMKLIATNSYPLRYFHYNYSSTIYSRFMAIVINE